MKKPQFILASTGIYLVSLAIGVGFSIYSNSYYPALIMGGMGVGGIIVSQIGHGDRFGKAQICPVCHGRGRNIDYSTYIECNGCQGKGWIEPKPTETPQSDSSSS